MFINAHDHLNHYDEHLDEALEIMQRQEILTLAVCQTVDEYASIKALAQNNPLIKKGFGIHPWMVNENTDLTDLDVYLDDCDFIGEIGLDYHWAERKDCYPKQREVFDYFIQQAEKYQKRANIHTKGAERDILEVLQTYQARGHIIHWYSGPLDLVDDFLSLDCYFTISVDAGSSGLTDRLIDFLPFDRILTETDGPRSLKWVNGGYGWPDEVINVAQYIAKRKNMRLDDMVDQIYQNYLTLEI